MASLCSSPITPSATSTSLITPWDCSSTIHDVVRTSSEVQNGSSTPDQQQRGAARRRMRDQVRQRIAQQQGTAR